MARGDITSSFALIVAGLAAAIGTLLGIDAIADRDQARATMAAALWIVAALVWIFLVEVPS